MNRDKNVKSLDSILLTTPESPYKLLSVNMDASSREIQSAFRNFFRKNPKSGVKVGKNSQNKLLNLKERAKVDAFCIERPSPQINVSNMCQAMEKDATTDASIFLPDWIEFSDLNFCHNIKKLEPDIGEISEIPYRKEFSFSPQK